MDYILASDLHMDTGHAGVPLRTMDWGNAITPILIAGDLGNGLGNFGFIEKLRRKGHTVFLTDGNHEHYANKAQKRSLMETELAFQRLAGHPSVVQLRSGLYLIMCNGWYVVEDEEHWQNYMNDSRHGALSAEVVNAAARRHADFVAASLMRLPHDSKAIVMTHTVPCEQSLDPRFVGSAGNPYYWNPHMERVLIAGRDSIAAWHHGHTHFPMNIVHEGVKIITNPRGYPGEVQSWRPLALTI